MALYLKDRRTGDLYGWNREMAKLPYMSEVDSDDEGFDKPDPDPTYVDPETGVAIGATTAGDDPDEVVRLALERAAEKGEADLTTDVRSSAGVETEVEVEDDEGEVEGETAHEDEVVEEEVVAEVVEEEVVELEPEPVPAKRRRR